MPLKCLNFARVGFLSTWLCRAVLLQLHSCADLQLVNVAVEWFGCLLMCEGLDDDVRTDFQVMKDLAMHTRVGPADRVQRLQKFISNITRCGLDTGRLQCTVTFCTYWPIVILGLSMNRCVMQEIWRKNDWGTALWLHELQTVVFFGSHDDDSVWFCLLYKYYEQLGKLFFISSICETVQQLTLFGWHSSQGYDLRTWSPPPKWPILCRVGR